MIFFYLNLIQFALINLTTLSTMKFPPVKFPLIALMIAILAFNSGCKHELFYPEDNTPIDTTGNDTIINPPEDTLICFESQILPLFVSNCAMTGCHDAITHVEGFHLYDYAHIIQDIVPFQPTEGDIIKFILENDPDKIMPPPPNNPLTASQIALIQQWINQGAQNTTNCASSCDTTAFLFSADIAPILSTFCNGCHSGPFPDAGINTSTYAGVQIIVQDGSLLGSIEHNANFVAMPKNTAQMNACNISKIRKWIQAGALNN